MTRLEKFLLANASELIKAETTNSRYFKVQNILIRVSDHVSLKGTCDLQIVIPTNDVSASLYTVLFGDSGKMLIWNFKQIKEFLPSMILMKEMMTKSVVKPDPKKTVIEKIDLAKSLPEYKEKKSLVFNNLVESKLKLKFAGALERSILVKSKSIWNAQEINGLPSMLHKEFGRGDSINDDFQIFLNCTSVDYNEVINIYKIVVIDNNKVPTIELLQEAYKHVKNCISNT